MSRAVVFVKHPIHGARSIHTVEPGALVEVAITRGATEIRVIPLCDVEGCTHPPEHNGPHRFDLTAAP